MMDSLRRRIFHSGSGKRPAALALSPLGKIPLDILLYIMDYLHPESAAVFSLSCMHLKRLLGEQHLLRVSSSTEDTLALLNLLALDLPDYVACPSCTKLHNIKNLHRYYAPYNARISTHYDGLLYSQACLSRDRRNNNCAVTDLFGATAFRMAMKRYRQKPECTELLSLMSTKEVTTKQMGYYIRQYREDCRVVQGSLMHRVQNVHISPKISKTTDFQRYPLYEIICPHIKFRKREHDIGFGIKRCHECQTEYCIDVKYYDSHGVAIFFTRWKNLGTSPEGEMWIQHLPPRVSSLARIWTGQVRAQNSTGFQNQVVPQDGELARSFEDSNIYKLDSIMTPGNVAELLHFQEHLWEKLRTW